LTVLLPCIVPVNRKTNTPRLSEANMSVSTQAQAPIAQVIAACAAYLANNDARVEREREALIEQHTTAGLFRKAKTR
jgi:hypothetical protein